MSNQTFVNNGTAMPTAGTGTIANVTSGVLGVFGENQKQVVAAPTITTDPKLALFLGYADGSVKKSNPIIGANVTKYTGARYKADSRDVWAIGYDRKLATGSIEVANDTDYTFRIGFKFDKNMYSERPLDVSFSFRSDAVATQQKIAIQTAIKINNHAGVKKDVTAIIVGDGTGAPSVTYNGVSYTIFGGTGATNYGVEITGKDISQFQNTSFIPRRPYFGVFADRTTGFGLTTTVTQINAMDFGVGTYDQVYNMENFDYGTEGVLNRRQWPIPSLEYKTANTFYDSAAITPTASSTAGEDKITFSATVAAILEAGSRIVIGSTNYEIKYFISTTVAVATAVVATHAAAAVKKRFQYSVISIQVTDARTTSIGEVTTSTKLIKIAFPAIAAGDAWNAVSAIGTNLKTLFDSYMASTPGSFAPITI